MFISHKNIKFILATFLVLISCQLSMAQLQRFPIPRGIPGALSDERQHSAGRTQQMPPLSLPFFEDFSKPIQDIYADTVRWEDSYSVWVNDGMSIRPPTINVATFDGLDSAGRAYSSNDVLLTGYADNLTSRPIDLGEGALSIAARSSVYLSFFYQWQGNVEAPDERDFLELEFRTAEDNGWVSVMTIFPKEDADPTRFYDTILQVSGDEFFHDNFQFRFRSYGRLSGPYDTWHLDYIYLNEGRNINDLSFPDRAIASQLGPLFGEYRAIPRDHFFSNEQLTPPTFEIRNMKNMEASINFRTEGFFSSTDFETGSTTTHEEVISKATPINLTDNVLLANEHSTIRMDTLPDISNAQQFPDDPGIDSTLVRITIALQTRDNIPLNKVPPIEPDSTGDYTENYRPIQFTTNDTISADYVLSSYYAYDDGVAEYAAGLIGPGNLVAYAFEIDTTYALKQDTLIAFDIYFPPYAITSNQTVDFFIYHDDNGVPGELWLRIPSRPVSRKGINEFQRIEFLPALLIDEKRFYIGWREPVAGDVVVGLDISNDTGEKIFVNTTGSWYQNEDVIGSLMLRPVFGSGVVDVSVGIDNREIAHAVYPNPTDGVFFIDGNIRELKIISLTGQPVSYRSITHDARTEIRLDTDIPGMYLLRYYEGGALRTRKIILGR